MLYIEQVFKNRLNIEIPKNETLPNGWQGQRPRERARCAAKVPTLPQQVKRTEAWSNLLSWEEKRNQCALLLIIGLD